MTLVAWQHTKIVCTLGPATDRPGVLEGMIRAGMDVARINMSHGSHDDHARRMQDVRKVSRSLERPVGILADLPGPKFRVGELQGGSRKLQDGARVYLAEAASGPDFLPIGDRALLDALRAGESVYLADGSVELLVKAAAADRVECEVLVGGAVRSGSGVNVPELNLPALVPTEQDRIGLGFAASQAIDWIGVSFVQDAEDLARVRACLANGYQPLLMAKIEKRRALTVLEAIGFAACQLAERLDARAIIVHVQSLPQAAAIARFRPRAPVVALTDSSTVYQSLTLVSGVAPLFVPAPADAQARVAQARDWRYAHNLARPGEQVVVLSASAGAERTADTLQVVRMLV